MEIMVAIYDAGGAKRRESIPVIEEPHHRYRVLGSPGFANGFASGDVFELTDSSGLFKVIERSGNVCLQIFYSGNKELALKVFGDRFEGIAED